MQCADFEVIYADYVDGTLDASQRVAVDTHIRECVFCRSLAEDIGTTLALIAKAEVIQPPPELLTKITWEIPRPARWGVMRGWSWLGPVFRPVLQPKFAMGMAMTLLSFSMLGRFAGIEVRQLRPSDLHPAKVAAEIDNRMHRTWERAVKYYENLKLVYEVQSRLQDWSQQQEEEGQKETSAPATGEKKK